MAAGKPLSARQAVVRLGALVFHRTDWTVSIKSNLTETPSFEFLGYNHRTANLSDEQITLDGWYDSQNNPYDSPFLLGEGSEIANVSLHLNTATSPSYDTPLAIIESIEHVASVKEHHRFKIVMWAQGNENAAAFNKPTGNP